MKKCPICLKEKKKFTKEHLPFKALYKDLSQNDNAAIIKICSDCNQTKSIWDQEILAIYGHIFNIEKAEKAQKSLWNKNEISSSLKFPLVASRAAMKKEGQLPGTSFNGIPMNTISQWMFYCSLGIYYFFEQKPFEGKKFYAIPQLTDNNVLAENFTYPKHNFHRINPYCAISLFRKNEKEAPLTLVYLQKDNRIYTFSAFMFENEEQIPEMKNTNEKPIINKPIRKVEPRDITNIEVKENKGFAYKGIKKVKNG